MPNTPTVRNETVYPLDGSCILCKHLGYAGPLAYLAQGYYFCGKLKRDNTICPEDQLPMPLVPDGSCKEEL